MDFVWTGGKKQAACFHSPFYFINIDFICLSILPGTSVAVSYTHLQGALVKFQQYAVVLRRLHDSLIIDRIAAVIGMADNIDIGILHRMDISLGILLPGTGQDAGGMEAGDVQIQFPQGPVRQIHLPGSVQNIQFRAQ